MGYEITIPDGKVHNWLYYETGFDQLHPTPDIVHWMTEQGYAYGIDWNVNSFTNRNYWITFPNSEIAALFVTRWSA